MSVYNIIYYSRKPNNPSIPFLAIMRNEGLLSHFRLKCVEDINPASYPSWLRHGLPVMMVHGIQQPLIGEKAYAWVNVAKQFNKQRVMQQNMINTHNYNLNQNPTMMSGMNQGQGMGQPIIQRKEFEGFTEKEMGCFSDQFAALKTDSHMPQNFVPRDMYDQMKLFTPEAGLKPIKMDKKTSTLKMKELEKDRQNQETFFKNEVDDLHRKATALASAGLLSSTMNTINSNEVKINSMSSNMSMPNSQPMPQQPMMMPQQPMMMQPQQPMMMPQQRMFR